MPTRARRPATYKQMALETAIRNPERYFVILSALEEFDGVVLNDKNLLSIVTKLYKEELVDSDGVDLQKSDAEIMERIIEVNTSRNGDGGFPRGYAARFWTYVRTPSEFGFVYARYNEPFHISQTVKDVLSGSLAEQEAFAVQAFRGNRRSPYRNVSNDFNFYNFIFEILKRRQASGHMLSLEQFTLAMFSRDGNVEECIAEIESHKFNSPEDVYAYLKKTRGVTTKLKTVTRDYPDVVLRMLVIMGMVSIKYTGVKLIGLNQNKINFFNELAETTPKLDDDSKEDATLFFRSLNQDTDSLDAIIKKARTDDTIEGTEYTAKLLKLIEQYSLDQTKLINEMQVLARGTSSLFKEMSKPLRLEFYTALLVASVYGDHYEIRPNYKADHEGKPYSHAPGGGGDIDIFNADTYWLIEVTLIQNRQQQQNSETTTVFRHMTTNTEFADKPQKFLSFVAPYVHTDTQDFFEHATVKNRSSGINFGSYTIEEFIAVTRNKTNTDDMKTQTSAIIERFRAELGA